MNTKLVSRDEKKVIFTSEISPEAFEASINKVYNKMRSRFNIPGFRKGKAPRKIIELNYGEGIFFEDAVNDLLPDLFEEAVKELEVGKDICGMPKIDIEEFDKNKAIVIKFEQELKPVPELGDYKNLVADDVKFEVTDEMVDERINKERENNARIVSIEDRPIKDMDTVNIDFEGSVEGVPFDGGKSENSDSAGDFVGFESIGRSHHRIPHETPRCRQPEKRALSGARRRIRFCDAGNFQQNQYGFPRVGAGRHRRHPAVDDYRPVPAGCQRYPHQLFRQIKLGHESAGFAQYAGGNHEQIRPRADYRLRARRSDHRPYSGAGKHPLLRPRP